MPRKAPETAPLLDDELPSPRREVLVWSFRRPARSPLWRFFAHLVIRLLIVTPLPPELQAAAALFPLSMLWPLFAVEGKVPASEKGPAEPASVAQDPLGNVTTFTRSQYVDAATGKTAIGPGGGVVEGPGGVELRIPEGAVEEGVTFKIEFVTAEALEAQFPGERPDLGQDAQGRPLVTLSGGLKIESEQKPSFKKELKLAFPLPAGLDARDTCTAGAAEPCARDAFYYVFRRLEGPCPDGRATCEAAERPAIFETIDHAFVEGAGEKAKVVTASYPFSGYSNSFGAFGAGGLVFGTFLNQLFLSWSFDSAQPRKPLSGVITGKVLRTRWVANAGGSEPEYQPQAGVLVSGVNAAGQALTSVNAITRTDGQFTLLDPILVDGVVKLSATLDGVTRTGTTYQANPADWEATALRYYERKATANITFPPVEPPPVPPEISIRIMKLVEGARVDVGGLVVAGTPLLIGFTNNNKDAAYRINAATVGGQEKGVRGPLTDDPSGFHYVLQDADSADGLYTPHNPGSYSVTVTALPALGSPVTVAVTFRVIAEGGGIDNLPDTPPEVITPRTVPKDKATGVPVGVFPQVYFTEPVKNIPGNVKLLDPDGREVGVTLLGVGPDGPIADVNNADAVVTSVTLQPLSGLRFSTKYTLSVGNGIIDLDKDEQGNPAPKNLVSCEKDSEGKPIPDRPCLTSFTTFGPEALTQPGEGATFGSPGIVVLKDRAYLIQNNFYNGQLKIFDITDPVNPSEVYTGGVSGGRPLDLAGDFDDGTLTGSPDGRILVTGVTKTIMRSGPTNLSLFDVTTDQPKWLGIATLATTAMDGNLYRLHVKGPFAYAATYRKGIQVVDLGLLKVNFAALGGYGTPAYWKAVQAWSTDGVGWGQETVASFPLTNDKGDPWRVWDLKVDDYDVDGMTQPVVVALGIPDWAAPLVTLLLMNAQSGGTVSTLALQKTDPATQATTKMVSAGAVALGLVAGKRIAVASGGGTGPTGSTGLLAVVDLTQPTQPRLLSLLPIPVGGDVLLKDDMAIVAGLSQVVLVSLTDLSQPKVIGTLSSLGGRLAMGENNILFSTWRSVFGGSNPLGGVRSAALATIATIQRMTASGIVYDDRGQAVSEKDISIQAAVIPPSYEMKSAQVEIYENGRLIDTLAAEPAGSTATATWLARRWVDPKASYTARAVIDPESQRPLKSAQKEVPLVQILFVDKRGEETFAPLTSDPHPLVTLKAVTAADVKLLSGGVRAEIKVSGEVEDALADIIPDKAADITKVMVGDQALSVTRLDEREERPTLTRPYAFRGKFEGTVSVDVAAGANVVVVEAENAIRNGGHDSFTLNLDQPRSFPQVVPTGNVYTEKFLDPFTLVASPMTPESADAVVVYHGTATGSEVPLVETGPSSLRFRGDTPGLGWSTLALESGLVANDPTRRDSLRGTLSTVGLAIVGQAFEFVETAPASGVFRNVALRLPTNEVMEVGLDRLPAPEVVDVMRVKLGAESEADLRETSAGSAVFTGSVTGLGDTRVVVQAIGTQPGLEDALLVFLDSAELSLDGYYLKLFRAPSEQGLRFRTQVFGPPMRVVPAPPAAPATLVGVENNQGSQAGLFEPFWAVAHGMNAIHAEDKAEISGQALDLTLEPPPQKSASGPAPSPARRDVRVKLPLVQVKDTNGFEAANVRRASDNPRPADRNQIEPKPYELDLSSFAMDFNVRRWFSSLALSKRVGIRGHKMKLTASYLTVGAPTDDLVSMSISGDGVTSAEQSRETVKLRNGSWRVRVSFSIDVKKEAPLGLRDLTFKFPDRDNELPKAFEVSRGRVVVFAIDGLSKQQFENARAGDEPRLDPDTGGTALNRIFTEPEAKGQAIRRTLSTTFPPITFSRWATIFSGRPPKETLTPALQWFNRQAVLAGVASFGDANQGLYDFPFFKDGQLAFWTLEDPGAYNRYFKVDFVYDKLRAGGFRSIVVNQQAGLGRGMSKLGTAGNDRWERGATFDQLGRIASSNPLTSSLGMDDASTTRAEVAIKAKGNDFDLMVVYLPGLDHYVHFLGPSQDRGEQYIREQLHGRINRIVKTLGELRESTVFAVFSDHGHYDTNPEKFVDFDRNGLLLGNIPSMRTTLQANQSLSVGDLYFLQTEVQRWFGTGVNVIFTPQFGMANVYVAGSIRGTGDYDWTRPPLPVELEPIVNNIFNSYMALHRPDGRAELRPWQSRPVADILVRVSPSDSFGDSYYMAVPRDYDPQRSDCGPSGDVHCGLAVQLVPLSALDGLGMGDSPDETWSYQAPERRLTDWISPNSGDIVLLANGHDQYQFEKGYSGNHGSLTAADSRVPVAFGYPGWTATTSEDDTLKSVIDYLGGLTGDPDLPIQEMVEAKALERFFAIP